MKIYKSAKLLVLAIVVSSILSACEKPADASNITVTYGTSFGMCVGYCKQSVEINASTTTYSKSKNQVPETKTCSRPTDQVLIKELLKVDLVAFYALPERIGCPDCADGGAEYIEVNRNGKKHRVTYEYGRPPELLVNAAAKLKPLLVSFQDCN